MWWQEILKAACFLLIGYGIGNALPVHYRYIAWLEDKLSEEREKNEKREGK